MKLRFSKQAKIDLEEIGDFIAEDNPISAESFVEELEDHCLRLLDAPNAYPDRSHLRPGLRVSIYGKYLVFFRQDGYELRIVRILHGARNLTTLLNI